MRWAGRLVWAGLSLASLVMVPGPALAQSKDGLTASRPPQVSARAAILVDAQTGAILYEKNAFAQMDPASLTKMMTALLVIEHGHLDRLVTVSRRADYTGGSSLHIEENEQYTRRDLLTGLLLRSGNDASVALAESEAGSMERFVAEMNVKAQELGAFNTSFENTHGMTRPGHYSSAYDLSLIARAALKKPLFRDIVARQESVITELTRHQRRQIHNTNQLLYGFPGADGVKTGTTDAAGKCLVASATRNGRQLIAVVLNSPDRWDEASRLLEWGFHAWTQVQAVTAYRTVAQLAVSEGRKNLVDVVPHQSRIISVPVGQSYETYIALPSHVSAPLVASAVVGYLTIVAPNQAAMRIPLYPRHAVARLSALEKWWRWLKGGH